MKLLDSITKSRLPIGLLFGVLLFAGPICAQDAPTAPASSATATAASSSSTDEGYQLGAGDKVRVVVFGEDNLGGDYDVDGTGMVRLPLIGQVKAGGLTVRSFEEEIKTKLDDGFMKDAKVSVAVVTYRPFYIIGEVNKPGEYPYVNDMSILNAIALAGGYTYRANDTEVYIQRNGQSKEESFPADQTTKVQPGDIVRVPERFF
jgi:protein involved in polysaccharide export with SLBB domain